MSGLAAITIPRFDFNKKNNIKTVIREISVVGREIRNQARLSKATHRLVLQLGPENSAFWVERANGSLPVRARDFEEEKSKDEDKKPSEFSRAERILKKDKTLPSGTYFSAVETQSQPESPPNNIAYIYFFPEGFVEQSVIQVTQTKKDGTTQTWTLIFNPLTGHSDVMEQALSLKDLEKQ